MQDPHVEELSYKLSLPPGVSYRAAPITLDGQFFYLRLADETAVFRLKVHCATIEEARALIDPFVDAWQVSSDVECHFGEFRLEYDRARIIGSATSEAPDQAHFSGASNVAAAADVIRGSFPAPPSAFLFTPVVQIMHFQYGLYRQQKLTLAPLAYMCASVVEANGGPKPLKVSNAVINRMKRLASMKGGLEARKATGAAEPFSLDERRFLENAIRALITRAGQIGADPIRQYDEITVAYLQ